MKGLEIRVTANTRGELVDVKSGEKKIRIVHTFPYCHRGGYVFPGTDKNVMLIDGSVTFYFKDPKHPRHEDVVEISSHTISCHTIPRGTAYREFTKEGVYFAVVSQGDDKYRIYRPYRKIVNDSL